eukprot:CAMPEP_0117420922 /NCGR_PEP_ID=MMETSP0758-20121206/2153_1 /TAXON_ID=63605 /ORGANISM="Percolomonas cosmopolitus, Strain AE-1 (ATCC 50343)" /LENGTH=201 /DNA_ID=CAMNT_0005202809 /DNA_START=83 /DNA_END=688 /DNA_ORIENTATION=+
MFDDMTVSDMNGAFFSKYIDRSKGQVIRLQVYSTKTNSYRVVNLTPCQWEGKGLIGCTIRFRNIETSAFIWHILSTQSHGKGEEAGLIANEDYLVGVDDVLFDSKDHFHRIREFKIKHLGSSVQKDEANPIARSSLISTDAPTNPSPNGLTLFVYNKKRDTFRYVLLHAPYLEAELGQGELHRIPVSEKVDCSSTPIERSS